MLLIFLLFFFFSPVRWDIQRIREQRMLQRLQQRMEKKKTNVQESEPEVSSFHPDLDSGISLRKINLKKYFVLY